MVPVSVGHFSVYKSAKYYPEKLRKMSLTSLFQENRIILIFNPSILGASSAKEKTLGHQHIV